MTPVRPITVKRDRLSDIHINVPATLSDTMTPGVEYLVHPVGSLVIERCIECGGRGMRAFRDCNICGEGIHDCEHTIVVVHPCPSCDGSGWPSELMQPWQEGIERVGTNKPLYADVLDALWEAQNNE